MPVLSFTGEVMTMVVDKELNALLKKANKRIDTLQHSYNNIYEKQVNEMIARLQRTAENLTGTTGHLKRGNIKEADIPKYKRALNAFLESELSTITGQNRVMNESKAKFEANYGEISEENYKKLTNVFESKEFQMIKERYQMYGNMIKDMTTAAGNMDYEEMILKMQEVLNDPETFQYDDGSLNTRAFMEHMTK